jgi:hypothetical protein
VWSKRRSGARILFRLPWSFTSTCLRSIAPCWACSAKMACWRLLR